MLFSKLYAPTLKEVPAEAEVISHKLLLRAGMIRKVAAGIYTFLPMGLRALRKIEAIVREEMDAAGALEILMPGVQPAELWRETGRYDFYGKELLRFKDRHDRDFCLGPTHEEVVTDLVRHEVRSYRQLPLTLYQIQMKFRDEIRPRFGLMRGREFLMKDAYTFGKSDAEVEAAYQTMYQAYTAIFSRLGLHFRAVEADSGAIGGNFSHEFMVLAETGEDTIAWCDKCGYAANLEKAVAARRDGKFGETGELREVATPGKKSIDDVSDFLKVPACHLAKTLLYVADGDIVAAMVRGDRELNEVKLQNALGATELRLAEEAEVVKATGAPVGFAGPVGLQKGIKLVVDLELVHGKGLICGANKPDAHLLCLDTDRDLKGYIEADLRNVAEGDRCPRCEGVLHLNRGIEVGHVFKLGTKYSESMKATFLDENGRDQLMIMGCYGIGVSRVLAACVEQNNDKDGILFPPAIAPFEVVVVNAAPNDENACEKAAAAHDILVAMGVSVVLDDRDERAGVKFKDADLLGYPMRLTIGTKGLARGIVEAKDRRTGIVSELPLEGFAEAFNSFHFATCQGWLHRDKD